MFNTPLLAVQSTFLYTVEVPRHQDEDFLFEEG